MNKQEIRSFSLRGRKDLPHSEYEQRCQAVSLEAIDLIKDIQGGFIHLFLPIKKNREVNTWPIYDFLIHSRKHTPVISKTHFQKNMLSHHPMTHTDSLVESSYGIPEPTHDNTILPEKIDLVFVPLLAFDTSGHRIGYGAGFYDRFLAQCRKETLKVGLAVSVPTLSHIDTNEFDIPLDLCINHKRLYDFRD